MARLARERDEARGKLEEVLRNGVAVKAVEEEEKKKKRGVDTVAVESEEGPTTKKPRASTSNDEQSPPPQKDLSKIPNEILTKMTSTWEILSKNRRAIAKKSKRSKEQAAQQDQFLAKNLVGEKKVNLGKSTARPGVLCLASVKGSGGGGGGEEYIVSGGHDKQAIVYNVSSGQIVATLSGAGGDVISVSGMMVTDTAMVVCTGSADGVVRLYSVPVTSGGEEEVTLLGSAKLNGEQDGGVVTPVNVVVHFSSTVDVATLIVAGSDGSLNLIKSLSEPGLELITHLKSSDDDIQFSSGCLHPDGLIYAAGTTTGKVLIYDLKTQSVAGTLSGHNGHPINCINISENGYHVATSSSVDSSSVHIWDLRKLKLSATIVPSDVGTVTSLSFDPMGLYLAYSGDEATQVCVVKDWDRVVSTLAVIKSSSKKKGESPPTCGGVVWGGIGGLEGDGKVWIGAGCDGDKPLRIWGVE